MAHSRSSSISSSPISTQTLNNESEESMGAKKFKRPQPPQPSGLLKPWAKVETFFTYVWLVIQVLLLIAGLTVLHFSTFMVTLSYCVYGYVKRRREFFN